MRSEARRNDGHAVPGFGKREQGMRAAAFEQNFRLEPRKAAGGVEGSAKPRTRYPGGAMDEARAGRSRLCRGCRASAMDGMRRATRPGPAAGLRSAVVWLNRVRQHLTKVNLAAFQHGQNLEASPLDQFHLRRSDNVARSGAGTATTRFRCVGGWPPLSARRCHRAGAAVPARRTRWRSSIDPGNR